MYLANVNPFRLRESRKSIASVLAAVNPAAAITTQRCVNGLEHPHEYPQRCNSYLYCIPCRYWHLKRERSQPFAAALQSALSVQRKGAELLEVTLTLVDCHTAEITHRARLLKDGWKRLTAGLRTLAGAYRWLEVTASHDEPELENVHLHGAFDIRLTGAAYIRIDERQQYWQGRWRQAVGPEARSAHVAPIRGLDEYASYMFDSGKFEADVDLAIGDPERFVGRAKQLSETRYRFHGTGSLAVN